MKKKCTGVQEWSDTSVNIQYGCENNCFYCYAKKMAKRFKRVPALGWDSPIIKLDKPILPHGKRVMFPSTHDITHGNLHLAIKIIKELLARGNKVLIVSKPHIECITAICNEETIFNAKANIEFRFTIGSIHPNTLEMWEPHAPSYNERMKCVEDALSLGFKVSISCEPYLDLYGDLIDLLLEPQYAKIQEIWIGAMNYIPNAPYLNFAGLYKKYKDNPKIKWKDSFFKQAKRKGVIL